MEWHFVYREHLNASNIPSFNSLFNEEEKKCKEENIKAKFIAAASENQ